MGLRSSAPMGDKVPRCRFCQSPLSSAATNEGLVMNLKKHGLLHTPGLIDAFVATDRADFVHVESYVDAAVPLGAGSQSSAPHVHAASVELILGSLPLSGPVKVLDIGAGCGYLCAVVARYLALRNQAGRVFAIEHIAELADRCVLNIKRQNADLLTKGLLDVQYGDALGFSQNKAHLEAYDVVHCGAAVTCAEPWLLSLVKPGGRVVAPIGLTDTPQKLCAIDKCSDGSITIKQDITVLYVPVVTEAQQRMRGEDWDEVVDRCERSAATVQNIAAENEDLYR
eukprot:TRINITY_DN27120_c0_g1_i1.p1 TRINITY_DN27120_c0_g1~~TRINITY_DN27120_c0_g1_i1.p1  ORF type:complete len:283 (-),score=48.53 TRINITY_DN27120_c0_g1_i1:268-1116(-)